MDDERLADELTERVTMVIDTKPPDVGAILNFLRGQRPTRPYQAGDGKERATAGVPSLTPQDRLAVTKFLEHHEHGNQAVAGQQKADADFAAPDGDKPTTSLEAQLGRSLHRTEIIKRLRKLNPNFIYERSINFPDIMGIYIPDEKAEMRDGQRKSLLCGFEYGYSPEFTVRHPNAQGAKKITRGWRSVIVVLAKKGYIEFNAACKLFELEKGRDSANWQHELKVLGERKRV